MNKIDKNSLHTNSSHTNSSHTNDITSTTLNENIEQAKQTIISYFLNLPGISTKFFTYDKVNKIYKADRIDLPDYPNNTLLQSTFLTQGTLSYSNHQLCYSIPLNEKPNYIFILKSEKTDIKAFFNFISERNNVYIYKFVGIYPFKKNIFHKLKDHLIYINDF